MKTINDRRIVRQLAAAACVLALVLPLIGHTDDGHHAGTPDHGRYYDQRYSHDRYYPQRGYVEHQRPRGAYVVNNRGRSYWYGGGVWYAPQGSSWLVVAPPIGVFVPILPPYYTTVWYSGMPYYYANDAYYVWRNNQTRYEVVDPPPQASTSTAGPVPDDIYMYPSNGQSADQQATDRYECHTWATNQTGFDPTKVSGGVSVDEARIKRDGYLRAMSACLEGRGYSVK